MFELLQLENQILFLVVVSSKKKSKNSRKTRIGQTPPPPPYPIFKKKIGKHVQQQKTIQKSQKKHTILK